jgi:PAS domain S-box-containing protein
MRKLWIGAGVIGAVVAVYTVATTLRLGGEALTVAVEDYGQALAALVAASACAFAAWRAPAGSRLGWALLSVSASCWALGELAWAYQEVNLGRNVPFPSPADAGFLTAIPFAQVALLVFPFGPRTAMGRLRATLDGLVIATSLLYVAWSLGLGNLESQARVSTLAGSLVVMYPGGDILLLSLAAMSLRRAGVQRPLVLGLGAAFASLLVADAAYAYTMLHGEYGALGTVFDAGWIVGYLLLALLALRFARAQQEVAHEDAVEMWQLAMPWVAVVAVIGGSVWVIATGRHTGSVAAGLGSAMGVFFMSSQFLTFNDALRLLVRTRRAEADLREHISLLAEVIGMAPVGIARIGRDLRIIDANAALAGMLGVPAKVLAGTMITHYFTRSDPELATRVERMLAGELNEVEVNSEMRCADGRAIWVHRRVTPVVAPDGNFGYFLVMFEDLTSKHQIEEAQRGNLAELERINRLKSEFMSMVSHEFRTALTGIQGYSEVLNTEDVSPDEVKEFAGDINSESQRLNRMITEMLDLDRIESGRIQLHVESLDLNSLVAGIVERAQMTTTRHRIESQLDPRIGRLPGDSDRLTQVMSNLVSNAIKYSPSGGDIVVATCLRGEDVEVVVKDHGQGIPPEFLKKIFGRYERYEGPGRTQVVGTGLGLAIAQQIIQLHKGRIWVESTAGQGSEFHFTIPAAPAVGQVA